MKELCEARVKPEMSSIFQTMFPQMDPLPLSLPSTSPPLPPSPI